MRCFIRLSSFLCVLALVFVLGLDVAFAVDDIPDTPPEDPPFLGGYYITGYDATLGNCTIYLPVNEGWCLDQYGFLFRYASGSVSGLIYTEDGTEYQFSASGFSTPRYRVSGSSYTYNDLYFNPSASNVVISNSFEPIYDRDYTSLLVILAAMGVILVVNLTHRR